MRALVEQTKAAGTWMVPTQILIENWYGPEGVDAMRKWPEMQYVGADEAGQWTAVKQKNVKAYSAEHRQKYIAVRRRLIKALHDGGVGVLLGSDAPQTWNVPGFSIHREIATYVAAGLTPFQALVTGTRAVAEHLGTSTSRGYDRRRETRRSGAARWQSAAGDRQHIEDRRRDDRRTMAAEGRDRQASAGRPCGGQHTLILPVPP